MDVQQFSVFCLRKKYPNIDLLNRFQHLFPFFSVLKRPEWLFAALEIKIIFSQSILPPKRLMRLLSPQTIFRNKLLELIPGIIDFYFNPRGLAI